MLRGPQAALHYRHFTLLTNAPLSIYLSVYLSNCSRFVTISKGNLSPQMLDGPEAALHYRHFTLSTNVPLSIYQSVHLSIYMSIYLSIYLSIHPSIYQSTYLSRIHPFVTPLLLDQA